MPTQENGKLAVRPKGADRSLSSSSLAKDSVSASHLVNTQKGSSTRLHKSHAVGHGRFVHTRVPSHGKNLNKLSKLGPAPQVEDLGRTRTLITPTSHTTSISPGTMGYKRNKSSISLHRPPSKASVKRNASHGALSRNVSAAKLGNQAKSEKAFVKKNLSKHGTNDIALKGSVQFEVGSDDQEEDWTEESASQSPATTRTSSRPKTPVTPVPREPLTPDEPAGRRSPMLPASPPDSPRERSRISQIPAGMMQDQQVLPRRHQYSHPPDAEAVTNRLLRRSGTYNPGPQTSVVSANVTPHHIGSPKYSQSQASISTKEPSMPADGISRFLSTTSGSGEGTPGSVTHLQQNLANLELTQQRAKSPNSKNGLRADARRVKSAANLSHKRLSSGEDSISPPKQPSRLPAKVVRQNSADKQPYLPSPFESARGADPTAGKSFTQLKLNLDREAASRGPQIATHPLMVHQGSMLNLAGAISMTADGLEKRVRQQYVQAQKDVANCRKYYADIIISHIPKEAIRKHQLEKSKDIRRGRDKSKKSVAHSPESEIAMKKSQDPNSVKSTTGSSVETPGRGKVRFDVGGRSYDESDPVSRVGSDDAMRDEGVGALLKRMWLAREMGDGDDGD